MNEQRTRSGNEDDVLALGVLAQGDEDQARAILAGVRRGHMAPALLHALQHGEGDNAYAAADAFEAFIRSGGNVALYEAVSRTLAAAFDRFRPVTLLDIGVGDGLALLPALGLAGHPPTVIDVVEPNARLLANLEGRLPVRYAHPVPLEAFVDTSHEHGPWDLAQASFSLQSIAPGPRKAALRALSTRVGALVIVEFDLPVHEPGSQALYASLAHRYELAASQCGKDAELVARGFLAPMLLGQIKAASPSNWEQSAETWVAELRECGFGTVETSFVHEYSWARAVCFVAWV